MAYCAQCGAEVQGSFCPACGATSGQSGSAPPPPPAVASPLDDNVASALCYLLGPLTGILFLVIEPYNRNRAVRFHAFQSIFVWLAWMGGFACLTFLAYLPIIGLLFTLVTLVYPIFAIGLWLFLMFKAYNREKFIVPVLGPLAESQA